jgi:F-box/TPR repeat protein Pof3
VSLAELSRAQPAELQQYGQTLYGRGDYKRAVEIFSQVITMQPWGSFVCSKCLGNTVMQVLKMNLQDPCRSLDTRAAAYCKLGDFELALRDAKQILRRDKSDERVFLLLIDASIYHASID